MTHARYKSSQENKRFPVRLVFTGDSTHVTVGTTVTLKIKIQSIIFNGFLKPKDGLENVSCMVTPLTIFLVSFLNENLFEYISIYEYVSNDINPKLKSHIKFYLNQFRDKESVVVILKLYSNMPKVHWDFIPSICPNVYSQHT